MTFMTKITVMIVDDSIVMQNLLKQLLSAEKMIEVVGVANDPYAARELIKKLNPQVLLLDVEMPLMDGVTFLKNIMRLRPMPVVMVSSFTAPGKEIALEALAEGAFDCIGKPSVENGDNLYDFAASLIEKIKSAGAVNHDARGLLSQSIRTPSGNVSKPASEIVTDAQLASHVIAIGASTGGIETIEKIITQLPVRTSGIVIVQHISKDFSKLFAKRSNDRSQLRVMIATHGQKILPGQVLIAPDDFHLTIKRFQGCFICELEDELPVHGHKPSIDKLFNSVAEAAKKQATGILLTGMGADGAHGLKAIQNAGGHTIAQDQKSSVVWGMPGAAVKLGAADEVLSISGIVSYLQNRKYILQKSG